MRGVHDPFVEHALWIRLAARAKGAIGPKVAVDGRHQHKTASGRIPILDPLTSGTRYLTHVWVWLTLASHNLKQFSAINPRLDLAVEQDAKVPMRDPSNWRPRHA